MSQLTSKLALATLGLLASNAQSQSYDHEWQVDTSYLSYVESDDRVSVQETIAQLVRTQEESELVVTLTHDTLSGASPTGQILGSNPGSTTTLTGVSNFDETRNQAGFSLTKQTSRNISLNFGGVVSNESDYESAGGSFSITRERDDKLGSITLGFSTAFDLIFQSGTETTPAPLGDLTVFNPFNKGERSTVDLLAGGSRVLNKNTIAQVNFSVSISDGYHSDPYKIISAADDNDVIFANFHDSRPDSRFRARLFGKVVHQLEDTPHSLHMSYRLYSDDWGINSHTADFRYHRKLSERQFLEPHVRLYRQSAADFYFRQLDVDEALNPILPDDGIASSDHRLDGITSATIGMKYGIALTRNADLRVRAEYLAQRFDTDDFDESNAVIFQTSFKYKF